MYISLRFATITRRMDTSNIKLQPGCLHLEIWYYILEHITDRRTFRACGLTCKILAALTTKIRKRHESGTFNGDPLRRSKFQDPAVAFLLTQVTVEVKWAHRFFYECTRKLPHVNHLAVGSTVRKSQVELGTLRRPIYLAASCFHAVNRLSLRNVIFQTFGQFIRLICAFPGVTTLELDRVSWRRDEGPHSWVNEPFAKSLHLYDIQVCLFDSSNVISYSSQLIDYRVQIVDDHPGTILKYDKFLVASPLLLVVRNISLWSSSTFAGGIKVKFRDSGHEAFDQNDEDTSTHPEILRPHRKAYVTILQDQRTKPRWWRDSFTLIDSFLALSCAEVDIELQIPAEALGDSGSEPLPFTAMRVRGTLRVNVYHNRN